MTSLFRPDSFLRSPCHMFTATFVLDQCLLWQINNDDDDDEYHVNLIFFIRISKSEKESHSQVEFSRAFSKRNNIIIK